MAAQISDSSLDDICKATMSKIKYLWEPQNDALMKNATRNWNGSSKEDREQNNGPLPSYKNRKDSVETIQKNSKIYSADTLVAPPLKNPKRELKKTLGKGWHGIAPMELDEKARRDLKIIRLRNYIDPRRFYKNPDKMKNVVGMGMVIEGSAEYTSSRLTNKERKQSLMDEILHDKDAKGYTKKVYNSLQERASKKKKIFSKKQYMKHSGKKAKKSSK